jgi:signal peptidase I
MREKAKGLVLLVVIAAPWGCRPEGFRQASPSMEPTIKKGEAVIADMTAYSSSAPHRWDVVVFMHPRLGGTWCSRVVGLPGETIDIKSEGVFVNGTNLPTPKQLREVHYVGQIGSATSAVSFPFYVPSNSYFVLGDNTSNAFDSRYWGPLRKENITGRVSGK